MTNDIISISSSQTFRSWVVIFNLRRHMAFLSLSLYNTPGLAPHINVLLWRSGDFLVSYSNRDTSCKVVFCKAKENRHWGSFMVDTGILFSNIPLTNGKRHSNLRQVTVTFQPIRHFTISMTLIPSLQPPKTSGFLGAFAMGVACQ